MTAAVKGGFRVFALHSAPRNERPLTQAVLTAIQLALTEVTTS